MNTSQPVPSEFEPYLSDAAKLRRLARGLIDDMHVVEDAVHAALAASAHRQYRDEAHRSRSLWASVRNAINDHRRSTANRAARERVAARPEALPAADDSTIRIETSKLVLDELGQLDERYRGVLTRHYLQDLSPKAIATQDSVDLNTVHRRIQRGRELLRERLERRAGGRENLLGLLIPFAGAPRAGLLRGLRSAASSSSAAWAAAVIVSLGLGLLLWFTPEVIEFSTAAAPVSGPSLASTTEARAQEASDAARTAVESRERVELRVVTGSGAQRVADAAVTWWPLPQRPNAAKEVEYWFQNNILEERVRDGAAEHIADANGVAQLPWSSTGFLAIASKGSLWGYTVVPASHRGPVLLEVVEDSNHEFFVHDLEGRGLEGMIVSLASIPYIEQSTVYLRQLTNPSGRARLRHLGAIRNSSTNPSIDSAVVTIGVCGSVHRLVYELTADEVRASAMDVTWREPIAHFDIEVVDAPRGHSIQRFNLECCSNGFNWPDRWTNLMAFNGRLRLAVGVDKLDALDWNRRELQLLSADVRPSAARPFESIELSFVRTDAPEQSERMGCAAVAGRLVDAKGHALGERVIRVVCSCKDYVQTTTAIDGRFELQVVCCDMSDQESEVFFWPDDLKRDTEKLHAFVPSTASRHDLGELRSRLVFAPIRGVVTDPRGVAVSCARVSLVGFDCGELPTLPAMWWDLPDLLSAQSARDGAFEVPLYWPVGHEAAQLPLLVDHIDYGQSLCLATPGQQGLAVQLRSPRELSGRVLLDPGVPSSELWIEASPMPWARSGGVGEVWPTHPEFIGLGRLARLDHEGGFRLMGLGHAPLTISVVRHGVLRGSDTPDVLYSAPFELTGSETVTQLPSIDLRDRFHVCRLVFEDATDSAPAPGVEVHIRDAGGFYASATSDSTGRTSLLVPTGAKAFLGTREYFEDEVDVTGPNVTVRVERRPTLSFRIEDALPALEEAVGMSVQLRAPGSFEAFDTVDPRDGGFQSLAPDRHRVALTFVVRSNGQSEPCTAPQVIDLVPGRHEPYLVKAPTQAEIDAAVRVLRSR